MRGLSPWLLPYVSAQGNSRSEAFVGRIDSACFFFPSRRFQLMQFLLSFSWMRGMARGLAIVSLVLVVMASLAACGGGSTTSGTTVSGPVNLTYWSWIPGIDKEVALWNSNHPNIHVTVQNVGAG